MGGKIMGAVSGFIKPLAQSVIKAVAPKALETLKKITDGFVSKGADFLKNVLNSSSLPGPLKSLGEKLIGKASDFIKNLGGGLLDKGLSKLMEMVTGRNIPGIGNVNVPGFATPERQTAIQANSPSTGSSHAAATGGTGGTSGSGSAGATGSTGAPDRAPDPKDFDMESIGGQTKFNEASMKFQRALTNMQSFFKAQSDILAGGKDVQNKISQNFR